MHHPFGDALAVEVGHLVREHDILHQQWPLGSSRLNIQLIAYGDPCSRGQHVGSLRQERIQKVR